MLNDYCWPWYVTLEELQVLCWFLGIRRLYSAHSKTLKFKLYFFNVITKKNFFFRYYEKLILNSKIKQKDVIEYVQELLKYKGEEKLLEEFRKWEIPRFPLNGKILKENGVPAGKMYGRIIHKLKGLWIDSEYKLTTDDLVKLIPSVIKENKK